MARRYWQKSDPLQDRIVIGNGMMPEFDAEPARQIIGVVSDQRDGALNRDPQPEMYVPTAQLTDAIQGVEFKYQATLVGGSHAANQWTCSAPRRNNSDRARGFRTPMFAL